MTPITSLTGGIVVSIAILLGLSLLATGLPASTAASPRGSAPANPVPEVAGTGAAAGAETGLRVEITHVRSGDGNVLVLVFDDPKAFASYDYEGVVAFASIPARQGALATDFPELVSGPYAVTFFHDENGDYDLNFDGMFPLEGYGTSGAKDSFHEPSFDEASVDAGRVSIRMHYLR